MSVEENCRDVLARIRAAEARAGRVAGDVKLIAVSKTKPLEMIDSAARAGAREFGENYVREAVGKREARPDLVWHFIGSLQTNKARDVVGRFDLIHSVDREKLARELDKAAASRGIVQDVLAQIHIGEEKSKHGIAPEIAASFVRSLRQFKNLRVRGLMCLPPLTDDPARARAGFAQLRELRDTIRREGGGGFDVLSMGTTHDFEWAIAEGATHVRVGAAIFGRRQG